MRVTFIPPSVAEYEKLFLHGGELSRGGGLGDITTLAYDSGYRRGGGIFSTLAGFAKRAFPFLVRNIIAPTAREFGNNVLDDISRGSNLKGSIRKHGVNALKNAAIRVTRGGGKRKRKRKRLDPKKCYKDIFSLI